MYNTQDTFGSADIEKKIEIDRVERHKCREKDLQADATVDMEKHKDGWMDTWMMD